MDYIFRWIQIRFLSGHQLDLFAGLNPAAQVSVPVTGTVSAPGNRVQPHGLSESASSSVPVNTVIETNLSDVILSERVTSDNEIVILSGSEGSAVGFGDATELYTTPPQQGIAPDLAASAGLTTSNQQPATNNLAVEDRGLYHTANAMKSIVDMGDAPSCATCGAIMTRNGSCYRCNECGSTSGCS
jgi:ribonucleoside-diphosphate reductase alpha chain